MSRGLVCRVIELPIGFLQPIRNVNMPGHQKKKNTKKEKSPSTLELMKGHGRGEVVVVEGCTLTQ